MNEDIRFHIPHGFELNYINKEVFTVKYERTGMTAMNFFLRILLLGWTSGCIVILFISYMNKDLMHFYFALLMLLVDIIMLLIFLYSVYCKKRFQFNEECLVIKTQVLYYKTTKLFTKTNITQVKQVTDGGEGKDSFPSWGLKMMYRNKKVAIILRQPHEKSLWLGKQISTWANVPFETVPPN